MARNAYTSSQETTPPGVGTTKIWKRSIPRSRFRLIVSQAERIEANAEKGGCYRGQTHGHKGFLLEPTEAKAMMKANKANAQVLFPFLIADDFLGAVGTNSNADTSSTFSRAIF